MVVIRTIGMVALVISGGWALAAIGSVAYYEIRGRINRRRALR